MEKLILITWLLLAIWVAVIAFIFGAVTHLIGLGFWLPAGLCGFGIACFLAGRISTW